jgi:hypothetical protein
MNNEVIEISAKVEEKIVELKKLNEQNIRLKGVCNIQLSYYQSQLKDIADKFEQKKKEIEFEIASALDILIEKGVTLDSTKTQRKFKSVSGDVVIKNAAKTINKNEEVLLNYLKKNRPEYVTTTVTEVINWRDYKKLLSFDSGGNVIDRDGNPVDGIKVETKPEVLMIELK